MNSWVASHLGGSVQDVSLGTRFFLLFLDGLLGTLCLCPQSPAGHCPLLLPGGSRAKPGIYLWCFWCWCCVGGARESPGPG